MSFIAGVQRSFTEQDGDDALIILWVFAKLVLLVNALNVLF